ncbi:MAG: glycosyltransferase [Imperialibacter sp.]|uniref:glycosyltransferase family 2 protein n=1 Tax=Imperialibacter sp. TaxID=2038411 RepID=UPI0032F00BDB
MSTSVIVPTYNGCHKLETILSSLESQSIQDFETVIVVDGSTDDTIRFLNSRQTCLKEVKVIEQPNKGRAGARNSGANNAKGDILIFFDDDMKLDPACIASHLHHQSLVTRSIAGGRQILLRQKGDSIFHQYRCHISEKWERPLLDLQGAVNSVQPFFTAANFSVSKTLFQKLGGFNEALTDAEDKEMAIRADKNGIAIFFLSHAVAFHLDELSITSYIMRLRQYQRAHSSLSELFGEGKSVVYPNDAATFQFLNFFKEKVHQIFGWPCFLKAAEKERLMKVLPAAIRHKFFDLVTTSNVVYYPES